MHFMLLDDISSWQNIYKMNEKEYFFLLGRFNCHKHQFDYLTIKWSKHVMFFLINVFVIKITLEFLPVYNSETGHISNERKKNQQTKWKRATQTLIVFMGKLQIEHFHFEYELCFSIYSWICQIVTNTILWLL